MVLSETGNQLAQTLDPCGSGYSKAGSTSSSFGWTGEQTDSNGFVYLRARYCAPGVGRFFQRDTWEAIPQPSITHHALRIMSFFLLGVRSV
jgi:RHS repeat-associated protein